MVRSALVVYMNPLNRNDLMAFEAGVDQGKPGSVHNAKRMHYVSEQCKICTEKKIYYI